MRHFHAARYHFGMSTGQASRDCLLNSALPEKGVWRKSTAFRQPLQPLLILILIVIIILILTLED
jgi:hypothetical protein